MSKKTERLAKTALSGVQFLTESDRVCAHNQVEAIIELAIFEAEEAEQEACAHIADNDRSHIRIAAKIRERGK